MKELLLTGCLLLCLLSGCGQRAEGKSAADADGITVETNTGVVSGTFDGRLDDGLPSGEGTFTAVGGWRYTGSFAEGSFAAGTVSDMPVKIPFGHGEVSAWYTGPVEALAPQGEGALADADGNVLFTGAFADGLPGDGTAEALPYTAVFGSETFAGLYTGPVLAGLPEGEGDFVFHGRGRSMSYTGAWKAGKPAGAGTLRDDGYTVETLTGTDRGTLEGDTRDGVPDGNGTFTARNSENVDYTYTGQWKNGAWDGQGTLRYASELYYDRTGTFTNGRFTPTGLELLAALGTAEPYFTLSREQLDYLSDFPELCDNQEAIPDYREAEYRFLYTGAVNYDAYALEPEKYPDAWLLFYNYLILDQWEETAFGGEYSVTRVLACNTVYANPIECYIFGEVANLSRATHFTMYGYPLAMTEYTNADGEAIPAIAVLVGSVGGVY